MAFAMAIVILVMGTNMLSSSTQASPVSLPSPGIDTSTDKQFISLIGKFISSIDKNILTRIRDTVGPLLAKVRQIFQIKVREDSHQIFKSERMEINGNKNDEQTSSSSSSSSSSNGVSGNRISLFPQWLRPLIKRSHLDSAYEKYFPVKKANVPIPNDQMEWKHNLVGQNIGLLQK